AEAVPAGAGKPEMGPLTTGLGEIFHFTVSWPGHDARDVRTVLDWEVAYALKTVPGVVEVNAWGGETREIEVRLRPDDMHALGVSTADVETALRAAGGATGGGALARGDEQVLVRVDAQYRSLGDVASQVVATRPGGAPVRISDVAVVRDGSAFRQSLATADGKGESVYAMVQMVAGGNAHEIVAAVKARLDEIQKRLPEGVKIEPFYDRASLVDRVLATVRHSLLEGGVIVAVVLLVLLGDPAAGLVVASAIPLSMLGAFALMKATGQTGNLMSLGAIDFGLVVDGAVVVVEGALATMAARKMTAKEALAHEGAAVGRPVAFGVLIIAIVYVPVLLLEGVEGKMFRPMAVTVLFALGTALVLSFTWIPALASLALRKAHPEEPRVVRAMRRIYEPLLERALARPTTAIVVSIVLVAIGIAAAATRGAEFTPRLEEGDLVVQLARPPSVSLEEAKRGTDELERALGAFPEVRRVISRTGSPDVATDIMGIEQSDVFVILRPASEWTTAKTTEALVAKLDAAASKALPGTALGWTQPIEMRENELLGGTRSDVGIKIYGDDFDVLRRLVDETKRSMASIAGATDIRSEPLDGLSQLAIRPDPERMGRLDVRPSDVATLAETMRAGREEGVFVDRERRFDVHMKLDRPPPPDQASIARAPLVVEGGRLVPLGDVATITAADGPGLIGRENARRRVQIECNVRGRDLASFVQELRAKTDALELPPGYHVEIVGQYERLVSASRRLALVVPLTLALIFVLLYFTFGEVRAAVLIFLNVPVAASG
ncbi:MAG TPA: efflux RND transporter permease subunit, partial [Polyangiaceae bacterium]